MSVYSSPNHTLCFTPETLVGVRNGNAGAQSNLASPLCLDFPITGGPLVAADTDSASHFKKTVLPVLDKYCTSCHNSEFKKGRIAFDVDDPTPMLKDQELWLKAFECSSPG